MGDENALLDLYYGKPDPGPHYGPDEIYTTHDVSNIMRHQQDERAQAGPRSAANIIATLLGAGVGAKLAQRAAPIPAAAEESMFDQASRLGKAAWLHQRGEVKRDNPSGFLEGLGGFGASTAGTVAAALTGHPDLAALAASGMIMLRPGSVLMRPHWDNVGTVAGKLREMQLREAAKQPPPDNSGFTLYADPNANASGAAIAEQSGKPSYSLSPNLRPADVAHEWNGDFPGFLHHIYRGDQKIGSASGYVNGDTANFSWLGASGQKNRLGQEGISQLRERFRELYPDVSKFEGFRSSGSRRGPAANPEFPDKQSVTIPSWAGPQYGDPDGR